MRLLIETAAHAGRLVFARYARRSQKAVWPGSCLKDGVASASYDPAIHPPLKRLLATIEDTRVKAR